MTPKKPLHIYCSPVETTWTNVFWSLLQKSAASPITVLVSSQAQKQWCHSWLLAHTPSLVLMPEIYTLDEVMMSGQHTSQSHRAKVMVAKQTVADMTPPLSWYESVKSMPGFLQALIQFSAECVDYQVASFGQGERGHETQRLVKAFHAHCETVPDSRGIEWYYAEHQKERFKALKTEFSGKDCYLFGFWSMKPAQINALAAIVEVANVCAMQLTHHPHHPVSEPTQDLLNQLRETMPCREECIVQDEPSVSPQIHLAKAASVDQEIQTVIQHLFDTLGDTGRWEDALIVVPQWERYAPSLIKAFQDVGIPCWNRQDDGLSQTPLMAALDASCAVFMQPTTSTLKRLLGSPFVSKQVAKEGLAAVAHQGERWSLEKRMAHCDSETVFHQWLCELSQLSYAWNAMQGAHDFCSVLLAVVERFQWMNASSSEEEWRHWDSIRMAMKEFCDFPHQEGRSPQQWLSYWRLFVRYSLAKSASKPRQKGVWVVQKSESYLIQKPHIIVMGLTVTQWPAQPEPSLFLTEKERAMLKMPTQVSHYNWDRFLFFSLMNQATKHLVLTTVSDPSRPVPLSFLVHQYVQYSQCTIQDLHVNEQRLCNRVAAMIAAPVAQDWSSNQGSQMKALCQGQQPESPYLGDIGNSAVKETVLSEWAAKPLGVTSLESYQKCPYQFFWQYMLNQKDDDGAGDDVTAKTWGIFVHDLCYQFMLQVQEEGLSFHDASQAEALKTLMHRVANECLARYDDGSLVWQVKREKLVGTPESKGVLDQFVDMELVETQSTKQPLFPVALEESFQGVTVKTREGEVLTITGKIDVCLSTQDRHQWAVLDYKTGKAVPTAADIKHFRHLQLPFYQMALREIHPHTVTVGGLIMQVNDRHLMKRSLVMVSDDGKAGVFDVGRKRPFVQDAPFFDAFKTHLASLRKGILSGHFSPYSDDRLPHMVSGRPMVCRHCSYKWVCRYNKRFGGLS